MAKNLLIALFVTSIAACSSSKKKPINTTPEKAQTAPVEVISEPNGSVTAEPMPDSGVVSAGAGTSDLPAIEGRALQTYTCLMGKDKREISLLERTDATGWGVVYSKWGETKTVAVAKNQKEFCDEVLERIKGKLSESGFNCSTQEGTSFINRNKYMNTSRIDTDLPNSKIQRQKDMALESNGALIDRTNGPSPSSMSEVVDTQ